MKKSLLFGFALCLGLQAMAQSQQGSTIPSPVSNKSVKYDKTFLIGSETPPFSSVYTPAPINTSNYRVVPTSLAVVTIGNTGYQLQTNRTNRNGLVMNSDGSLSASFTYSSALSAWPDRGTGYNYNSGSGWGPAPTIRIETVRTGWGNIAVTTSGREHVIAHSPPNMPYNTRPVKGTGNWTESLSSLPSPIAYGNLWPRMASGGANGNSLHAISVTGPVANGGTMLNGQDGALCYARSTDDGVTWSAWTVPTQHDSAAGYSGMGGDSYAIDARGDVIAYVFGDYTTSQTLMKSTDNGVTWTKTTIKNFPIPYYTNQLTDTNNDATPDTLITSDGSMDVVIDNNNVCHVFFGKMRVLCTDTSQGLSYFPVTDGLYYWKEGMAGPIGLTFAEDIDQSGTLDLPTPQTSGDFPFGIYLTSMVSHPTASVNTSNGNLYLLYDGVIEGTDNGSGYAYRNIYGMMSSDGGTTWSAPMRFSPDAFGEQVFPNSAPHFTGTCVPFWFQNDGSVGHGFNNQPSGSPDPQSGPADILYDCMSFVGVDEINNNVFSVGNSFPNPTSGMTEFNITMKKNAMVTVEIFNTVGAKVSTLVNENLASGDHRVTYDATQLSSGVYYYTVNAGGFKVTRKMIKM